MAPSPRLLWQIVLGARTQRDQGLSHVGEKAEESPTEIQNVIPSFKRLIRQGLLRRSPVCRSVIAKAGMGHPS